MLLTFRTSITDCLLFAIMLNGIISRSDLKSSEFAMYQRTKFKIVNKTNELLIE